MAAKPEMQQKRWQVYYEHFIKERRRIRTSTTWSIVISITSEITTETKEIVADG
jgi:hypothetical protein